MDLSRFRQDDFILPGKVCPVFCLPNPFLHLQSLTRTVPRWVKYSTYSDHHMSWIYCLISSSIWQDFHQPTDFKAGLFVFCGYFKFSENLKLLKSGFRVRLVVPTLSTIRSSSPVSCLIEPPWIFSDPDFRYDDIAITTFKNHYETLRICRKKYSTYWIYPCWNY